MTLYRRNRYRVMALVVAMAAIAVAGPGMALAGPPSDVVLAPVGDAVVPGGRRDLLVLADASEPGGGVQGFAWPESLPGQKIGPPADKNDLGIAMGVTSATIIRPLKGKKFALALMAGVPAPGNPAPSYAGQLFLKRTPSNLLAFSSNETIQWVVLTDGDGVGGQARHVEPDAALRSEASWRYSVGMIFVPVASLAVRAALSLDPGEEEFDTRRLGQAFEQSRIGVSIGLNFRPKDGVLLDLDYARVMKRGEVYPYSGAAATSDPENDEGPSAGDDVVSISLSIQF